MSECKHCGREIDSEAIQGLCPECLMKAGLGSAPLSDFGKKRELPGIEKMREIFPQLEILEFLGMGGMGAVYKARQPQLDRFVALKILLPEIGIDPAFTERFSIEARALARLAHPNILTIHDFGQAGDLFYLIMEYVDGLNLRQLLDAERMSPREALAIVPQICDALQFAHDNGIIHRDIKPENILLDRLGRVKVADFGLAKLMGGTEPTDQGGGAGGAFNLTEAGETLGTPQYMAPEQVERPREVDHRADIYALGVVFYQMLTGELPGKRIEPPSRKVRIDVRLDEVVLRALEKEPARRYQRVGEVKTRVETISGDMKEPKANNGISYRKHPRHGGWWTPVLATLLHAVLFVVLTSVLIEVTARDISTHAMMEAELPSLSRIAFGAVDFLRNFALLLAPLLLALDLGFCWLSQSIGGRKGLSVWLFVCALGMITLATAILWGVHYPMTRMSEALTFSHPNHASMGAVDSLELRLKEGNPQTMYFDGKATLGSTLYIHAGEARDNGMSHKFTTGGSFYVVFSVNNETITIVIQTPDGSTSASDILAFGAARLSAGHRRFFFDAKPRIENDGSIYLKFGEWVAYKGETLPLQLTLTPAPSAPPEMDGMGGFGYAPSETVY